MSFEKLFNEGLGFMYAGGLEPFPFNTNEPVFSGDRFGLNHASIKSSMDAVDIWRTVAAKVMGNHRGRELVRLIVPHRDWERGEFESLPKQLVLKRKPEQGHQVSLEDFFSSPLHVTRADLVVSQQGRPLVLDPNVMPYGIGPMVALNDMLGHEHHLPYVQALEQSGATWVCDHHGNAPTVEWLCRRVGIQFQYSDHYQGVDTLIRLSREKLFGNVLTIGIPGIRVFELQLWNALIRLGIEKSLGLGFNPSQDENFRINTVPTFLVKHTDGVLYVAQSIEEKGLVWVRFCDFLKMSMLFGCNSERMFIKRIYTSGSRQVAPCKSKEADIIEAMRCEKIQLMDSQIGLMQPAVSSSTEESRYRLGLYFGPETCYGAEILQVPKTSLLVHGGSHAQFSSLTW